MPKKFVVKTSKTYSIHSLLCILPTMFTQFQRRLRKTARHKVEGETQEIEGERKTGY